jgi:hypothetical protein
MQQFFKQQHHSTKAGTSVSPHHQDSEITYAAKPNT